MIDRSGNGNPERTSPNWWDALHIWKAESWKHHLWIAVGAITICWGIWMLLINVLASVSSYQKYEPGNACLIREIILAPVNKDAYQEWQSAIKVNDDLVIKQLIADHQLLPLWKETMVLPLETSFRAESGFSWIRRVRILEGTFKGKVAWVEDKDLQPISSSSVSFRQACVKEASHNCYGHRWSEESDGSTGGKVGWNGSGAYAI